MSQLLAISCDVPASPYIELTSIDVTDEPKSVAEGYGYGWGFAWYPVEMSAAVVVKDVKSQVDTIITDVLSDWRRFHSTLFMCHFRGTSKRSTPQDTQPFQKSYAGSDWLLLHNGNLHADYVEKLPLPDDHFFDPLGKTDSERVLCWLLAKIHDAKAKRIRDIAREQLYEWFQYLDTLGQTNFMLSDGRELVVYQDTKFFNPLFFSRLIPPHQITHYQWLGVNLHIGLEQDRFRTYLIFSTDMPNNTNWQPMQAGEMLVCSRGKIIWDNLKQVNSNFNKTGGGN